MSDARIMICVPAKDRRSVVEQCIPTIAASKAPIDSLRCYNDGSTEYDSEFLTKLGADWAMDFSGVGVEAQRRIHIMDFMEHSDCYTHLVFADSDSFWDAQWRQRLLEISDKTHALVCGYNTQTHEDYKNNTIRTESDIVWRHFAPGVSYLLRKSHVKKLYEHLPVIQAFDWAIPSLLGYKCAVSRTSYCDHIGWRGMHDGTGLSKERALNPTPWLVEKRKEILANLGLSDSP